VATNTKHERLQDVVSPMQWAIKAATPYVAASGTMLLTTNV